MNSRIKKKIHKRGGYKKYKRARIKLLLKASYAYCRFGRFQSISKNFRSMNFSNASLIIRGDEMMHLKYHKREGTNIYA